MGDCDLYPYLSLSNRQFTLPFCTCRRLQIFSGFSHKTLLTACTDCLDAFSKCSRTQAKGTEGCDELKRLTDTLLSKCWWGERSPSHWCEAQSSRQTKHALMHTLSRKQLIIIHLPFHSSSLWFHGSPL